MHERDQKGRPDSPQTIEIYFNFIGKFEMPHEEPQPMPEEIEQARLKEEIRQKRHEQYLRRKESGWQKAYYEKTKQAKKTAIDAAKNEIRKEDQANGVYYLPNAKYAADGKEICLLFN